MPHCKGVLPPYLLMYTQFAGCLRAPPPLCQPVLASRQDWEQQFGHKVGLMLAQRRRRWANIKPTFDQYLVC